MIVYKQCSRCVMDNRSDNSITFDDNGYCNYCTQAYSTKDRLYFPNEEGQKKLDTLLNRLKMENVNKKYDCIMGISGGLDSSYLAYLGSVKWGLRILAVHIDDGFDTDISKRNIERISKFPNFDLQVITPDSEQFSELTKAYMRAVVPNLACAQDNVLFACLYKFMKQNKIRSFLSGGNFALESILQRGYTHDPYDLNNMKYIFNTFGKGKLDKIPLLSNFNRDIDRWVLRIESPRPLNYIDYNRDRAMDELNKYCGFEYYGSKHLENHLTKFIQQYWFFKKFNVDKRTSHLSSLIISGQMTREQAQDEYNKPLYDDSDMENTIDLVLSKINMSKEEFEKIMEETPHEHSDYPTSKYDLVMSYIRKLVKSLIRR